MTGQVDPFRAHGGGAAGTVSIAAGASTGRVALVPGYTQYEVYNAGTDYVSVAFGDSTITASLPNGATAGSYVVGPGQCKVITVNNSPTNMAAISNSGTQTVFVTAGQGN